MGTKERRERIKQEVREGILAGAREIASQEGWQAVTIRKVAERIEYSPPTIYEYFENKEAILLELLRQGFDRLHAAMQAAQATTDDPELRVISVMHAYWDFAFRCPELYQVMHSLGGVTFNRVEAPAQAKAAFQVLLDVLENWKQANEAREADVGDCADILWGTAHGLIALTMAGRISEGQAYSRALMDQAIHGLLQSWCAKEKG
jgi:AcrR family transcriptional regulator